MPNKWEPTYWFLDAGDAHLDPRLQSWAASYNNINAAFDLDKPYTSGNDVVPLVDGQPYMLDLLNKIRALAQDDILLIAGWEFSKDRFLDRNDKPNSLLHRELRNLVHNTGVKVGLIAFNNPIPTLGPSDFVNAINKVVNGNTVMTAVADGTKVGTAHHEKVVFVGASTFAHSYAYVGGIDLSVDRMDDNNHNRTTQEKRQWGWHDMAVRVNGRAIMQLWANFADRWDSIYSAHGQKRFAVPSWATNVAGVPLNPGTQHVQVLRTVGEASPKKQPTRYMPNGERTILRAFTKAISKAERYIYIEEQFLWDGRLAKEIGAALLMKPQLHLIVVLAAETDMPSSLGEHNFYLRTQFFKTVMNVQAANQIVFGPTTRVHPYGLYQLKSKKDHRLRETLEPIYVHSKLIIIDDRYVAVGSANVNERSMYIDTEMTLGIVDGATQQVAWNVGAVRVCNFAKNLRETLWQEHSGIAPTAADPIDALVQCFPPYSRAANPNINAQWPTTQQASKAQSQHHLRCWVKRAGRRLVTETWQKTLDRKTRVLEYD